MSDPWVIRWRWNTGYSGEDRFSTAKQAVIFCDEMLKRATPPTLDLVSLSVVNETTGQRLGDYFRGDVDIAPESESVVAQVDRLHAMGEKTCGTCDGTGEIPIIQTGKKKTCSRCDGTGKEST